MDSCFISICNFGSFKNPFATITGLPELCFRFSKFTLLVNTKKAISINYGSSTSSWKLWRLVRLDLIHMLRDIFINFNLNPLTKFISSSRSTNFKKRYPLIEHLSNDHGDRPNQHENSHKLRNETGHSVSSLMESQWKLRQPCDQNFPIEGKPL